MLLTNARVELSHKVTILARLATRGRLPGISAAVPSSSSHTSVATDATTTSESVLSVPAAAAAASGLLRPIFRTITARLSLSQRLFTEPSPELHEDIANIIHDYVQL